MIFDEVVFQLKDGRQAVLRSPREEDAQSVIRYLVQASGETEFLLRYPEEWAALTVEKEQALLRQKREAPDTAMLMCLVDGQVIGNSEIAFLQGMKTRHRARVAIAILKDYWGQGIGTRMFERLIAAAQARPEITQMELEFIEGNARARGLYEKMGFRIVGAHPDAIRLRSGETRNEYLMIKPLNRGKE
ncbi:MAG: GNAT family N-acetyltransferase [Clostridia bacterium]|nr:GNAT family N-acetyltransferase [Clostridia bacterium]